MKQNLEKMPNLLLRLEGTAVLIAAIIIYSQLNFSWWHFALLLTPDLAMLGYLVNKSVGSLLYNAAHTYILPVALGIITLLLSANFGLQFTLIWLAHIGLDRFLGYGLKYPSDFKQTHFSKI